MNIESVISTELINLSLTAGSKEEALMLLIELLYENNRISDKEEFLREVLDRENTETTDLGFGIAIPHGRCSAVTAPSIAIGKLQPPLTWSENGESQQTPVYGIFLMASSPDNEEVSHMEIIARVATLLIDDQFVAYFKNTQNEILLLEKIKSLLGEE